MVKKKKPKKESEIINRTARRLNDDFNSGKLIKKKNPETPLSLLELDRELSKRKSIEKKSPKKEPIVDELPKEQSFQKESTGTQPFKNNLNVSFEKLETKPKIEDIQEDENETSRKKSDLGSNHSICSKTPNDQDEIKTPNDQNEIKTPNDQHENRDCKNRRDLQPIIKNNRFMWCFPFNYQGIYNKIYFSTQVCWLFFNNWCLYRHWNFLWSFQNKNKNKNQCFYWGLDYWSLKVRNSNFDSLWKKYSHLNGKKVKLLLNNKIQKKHSGVIIIYVSRVSFFGDSPININYETVIEDYYPLYEEQHIIRFQKKSETHNLYIYWNTENNRFGFIFDGLDVDILKIT